MPRQSAIPEEVRQYIPCKCCRLRRAGEVYLVYKYHAVKLPSGKWSRNYGTLIGTIVPGEGFAPNKDYEEEVGQPTDPQEAERQRALKEIASKAVLTHPWGFTTLEYGPYGLLISLSWNLYGILKRHFSPVQAAQIYAYALILAVQGFLLLRHVEDYYQGSILAIAFPEPLPMEESDLDALLQDLDRQGEPMQQAERDIRALGIRTAAIQRWVQDIYRRGEERYFWEEIHFQQDDAGPGLQFILRTAAAVLARLAKAVRELHKSNLSAEKALLSARRLHLSQEGDTWQLRNARPKEMELLRQLGFVPRETVSTREELL